MQRQIKLVDWVNQHAVYATHVDGKAVANLLRAYSGTHLCKHLGCLTHVSTRSIGEARRICVERFRGERP